MKLDKLHIFQRDTGLISDPDAASVIDECIRRPLIDSAVSSCSENNSPSFDRHDIPRCQVVDHDSQTPSIFDHQLGYQPFIIKLDLPFDGLLVERVEDNQPCPVSRITCTRKSCPAKRPLGDHSPGKTAERDTQILQLIDGRYCLLTHQFRDILVSQIIASLDGIKGVLFPGVIQAIRVVSQGSVYSSLGGNRMGAERMDLGYDGDFQSGITGECGRQPGQSPPNDKDVLT